MSKTTRFYIAGLLFLSFSILSSGNLWATVLYPEDVAKVYVNKDLGITVTIPDGWEYDTSGAVIERSRERARELTAQVMNLSKEEVTAIDEAGSPKGILIQMHASGVPIPTAQIVTRDLTNVQGAPATSLQHLSGYMRFVSNMTPVDIQEPVSEVTLNGTAGAHVAYETQLVLMGVTYRTRSDVYSFFKNGHSIDLTIIQNLDSYSPEEQERSIQTLLQSFWISS